MDLLVTDLLVADQSATVGDQKIRTQQVYACLGSLGGMSRWTLQQFGAFQGQQQDKTLGESECCPVTTFL